MKDLVALANVVRDVLAAEGVFVCGPNGVPLDPISEAHFLHTLASAIEEHVAVSAWDEDITQEVEVDNALLNACKDENAHT